MMPSMLEIFYKIIQASKFREFLDEYHFELTYARYDYSPRNYEVSAIIFESSHKCSIEFVYPRGTVNIYIGPKSSDFLSTDWLHIDHIVAYLTKRPVVPWYGSKFFREKDLLEDILQNLYEMFIPHAQEIVSIFQNNDRKLIENIKEYANKSLRAGNLFSG
jgi:hypothetical protein